MSNQYTHQVLKVVVAQVCETIGWNSITASSLELMVDVLDRYLKEICKTTHNYTELYNRTEVNLDDLGLAFRELGINLSELEEYIQYVDPIVSVVDCPKFPIKKESHLNFLKPGSKEVLTRPMHIHEHLPPINPPEEEETITLNGSNEKDVDVTGMNDDSSVFKRPSDGSVSDQNGNKKPKMAFEEEGRPTREIQSVMMTTSGFISPAREGKLPESKPPNLPPEFKPAPPPPPPAKPPSPFRSNKFPPMGSLDKKFEKKIKKKEKDKEKKKERIPKPDAPIPLGPLSIAPPQQAIHHQVPQSSPHLHQTQPNMMMSSPSIPHMRENPHIVPQQISPQMPGMSGMTHMSPAMSEKLLHKKMMAMTKKQGMKIPKLFKKHKLKEPKLDNTFPPFMKSEKKKNPVGRPPKNPLLPSKYMQQKMALAASQGAPNTSFMPGSQNLHPNPMSFSSPSSMEMPHHPQPHQQPPLHAPQQPLVDGKLITEPDRNKLNIFKKIQGKNKDDLSHKSLNTTAPTPIDFSTPQKIERPELDIFRTGPQSSLSPQFDMMGKIPKKPKPPKSIPSHEEMPINMSLTKNVSESQFTYDDLALPKTPNFPRTPEMKMEKKKKRKEKEKKMKGNDWPMSTFFNDNAGPSNINNPFLQKVPENPANLLAGTGLTQAQQNLLFPFGNLSNLGNLFPSGPGLIPNSGLFPPFSPLGSSPFGLNPPLGMPGSDLKFPKQSKKSEKKEFGNILPDKSLCNVAPLVPPSLTIEPSPPKHSAPRFDLPLGAEKLPAATQITPIKSYDKSFESMKPQSTTITSMSSHSHKMEMKPVEPVTTYDLTSSPEPVMPPKVKTPQPQQVPITPTIPAQMMGLSESQQLILPPPISSVPHSNPQLSMEGDIVKIKDKSEKKKDKEHKKDKKDKDGKVKKKKDKKDKSKNREGKEERKEKKEKRDKEGKEKSKKDKKEKRREKERASSIPDSQSQSANDTDTGDNNSTCSVPKLTLKLANSPRPNTPDVYKKISKVKKDDYDFSSPSSSHTFGSLDVSLKIDEQGEQMMHGKDREVSPELAKIAPLITRPPKQKPSKRKDDDRSPRVSGTETDESPTKEGKPAKLRPPIPEIGNSSQANPINPSFKPSSSSELVSSPTKHSKSKYGAMGENIRDADGNEVWICPSCGCPDDGTPMIGCDGCDAWYHWVCVGIQVPPDANEDWYCRVCLSKKQGDEKKKKKRKKDKIKDH